LISILVETTFSFSENNIFIGKKSNNSISITGINEINRLLKRNQIKTKKDYFKKFLFNLNETNEHSLNYLLSENQKQKYLSYLKKEIIDSKQYITEYFFDAFPLRKDLFNKVVTLKNCEKTTYDHNTVTGRLKVTGGTNYLVMKESDRKKLIHKDSNRKLYEIDFKSCEPNFYIKSQNIKVEGNDIYEYLMEKFKIDIPRSKFKRGLLSLMYGANDKIIASISKININKIKEIKNFLQIGAFKEKIELEYEKNGCIYNFYKRPLLSNNNLVNHWIQSSSADFCCLSFNEYLNNNPDVELHGVIHDAIIISTKSEIKESYLTETLSNIKIPITIKKL
jgi:hypothetical protein